MELDGGCNDAFEKWLWANGGQNYIYVGGDYPQVEVDIDDVFDKLLDSMKFGYYVDFFDSVGIEIIIERRKSSLYLHVIYAIGVSGSSQMPTKQTRPEARTAAIEKACEIFNSTKPTPSHKQQSKQ